MRRNESRRPRRGFRLIDLVVLSICVGVIVLFLLPLLPRVRQIPNQAKTHSANNLKQIGIAINGYAAMNNLELPNAGPNARYWFCGVTEVGGVAGPGRWPEFKGGLLSEMEGNTKVLAAPLDPNRMSAGDLACCYSIPAKWADFNNGNMSLPMSFPRGVSHCIVAAEMTTFGVTYNGIRPFADDGPTMAVSNTPSSTANIFCLEPCRGTCQVVMADGSVRAFTQDATSAAVFRECCNPQSTVLVPSSLGW